jgi:hypothetical protein
MGLTVGHGHAPTMICDDRPANRQPHTHSVGFRCKERIEDAVEVLRIDPRSGIFHGDNHMTSFIDLGLYSKNALTIRHGVHCVNGVHNQIHDDLPQLDQIGRDPWELVGQFGANRYTLTLNFVMNQRDDLAFRVYTSGQKRLRLIVSQRSCSR